jgi:uncharacterized protein (TIGR03067 family)
MPKLTDHPSREELSAYSLGQLPEERAVAIDCHISECEPCCETIVELSSEDTFAGLLQEAGRLPTDQTADHDSATANSASFDDIPQPLSEHPRYEILGLIGKGGMSDVYKARHRKMERTVALKVINRGLVQKAEAIDRFHREVKAAAQLSHPNIVTSHDADHAGDFHFMVMEFVDGIDLSQTVKKRGALPVAEACDYIRQAAIGLQHAHERGMVHRDIKPHNMMVTADGTVKILDFGLASLAPESLVEASSVEARGELTAAGAIMGTPDFISPEQADDARKADIRSDIYSLGATLYCLLSGRVPFDDGSVMHKLKSHAQVEPAPLNSVRDDVPEELVAIVSTMMAKDPDERYLTPKDVAEALESFLRTWQPGEENTPRQGASNGGNDSGSDGQKPISDDSNPSRLPMVAKLLLYTSLLPIGLTFVNEFVPLPLFSGETDWFWYCVLTSIALSTIGGIVLGVHQGMSNIRDGQRKNGMTTGQTALIILILALSALGILNHMIAGNWHIEVTPQSDRFTLGTHPLTIVNTSGEKPFGGTHRTHKDGAAGITTHSFKSANGRYKITLVDKVLTVNGEKYTLENPTDAIRIVDDRVEITKVTSLPDGERFQSTALSDDIEVRQILDRMAKAYAQCKSYRDSGVIKSVFLKNTVSPEFTVAYSFTTAFERPDRFRFEIKDEEDERSLIFVNGQDLRTWWDVEPGIQEPESLEIAMSQAIGFTGADVGRIPGMLMPQRLGGWVDLDLIDPKPIKDGELQNIECFRLEYSFRDEQVTLWIDKQSYLVRRIDERIKADDVRIERTTTYDPTIDGKIPDKMLEFDPPAQRSADNNANTHSDEELKQLQGEWKTESLTEGGKSLSAEDGSGGLVLQIKGNTFVTAERKPNGETSEVDTGRIEINSSTSPKTIDFIGRTQSTIGIYEFKDGALRVCLVEHSGTESPGGERISDTKPLKRPTTFDSPVGSNIMLLEFTKSESAQEHDVSTIQGTWQVTYSEDSGRIAPQEMLRELRFVIDEHTLTTEIGGRKSVSTYKLDPSTNPKSTDLIENGRTKQAIYDLVGDTLRICIAESGEQRPTAFDSQPNSANDIVLILKRVKPNIASADGTEDQKHNGPLSEKLARSLIPTAASISNEDFQKLQTNPEAQTVKNKSLSLALMTLDIADQSPEAANDFRFLVEGYPKPSEFAAAMSPSRSKGYFSIIQPDYITECKITTSTDEIARGKVTFNAPKLYFGSAIFEAQKYEGKWRIERFYLPSRQISIVLGEDGNWQLEGKEAPNPSD